MHAGATSDWSSGHSVSYGTASDAAAAASLLSSAKASSSSNNSSLREWELSGRLRETLEQIRELPAAAAAAAVQQQQGYEDAQGLDGVEELDSGPPLGDTRFVVQICKLMHPESCREFYVQSDRNCCNFALTTGEIL